MRIFLCLTLVLLGLGTARAQPAPCYLVVRLRDGAVVAQSNPDALRIPASTLKVATAAALMERFDIKSRLTTAVRELGTRSGSVLHGDLVLQGGWDPGLTVADLDELAGTLFAGGLRRVCGRVEVYDPHRGPPLGPGWAWDDATAPFSAPVSGLVVNEATTSLEVVGREPRQPPAITSPGLTVQNDAVTEPGKTELRVWRAPGVAGLRLVGHIAPGRSQRLRVCVVHPALRCGKLFVKALASHGIAVDHQVVSRARRPLGLVIAVHHSRPVERILTDGLARSDDLVLEMLYALAGSKPPAELAAKPCRMVDGSGLSRYNLVSPRELVTVLCAHPDLAALLPRPGSGTLKDRFQHSDAAPFICAKTGTMSNVSGLVGYLFPGQPRECAFAILTNDFVVPMSQVKHMEESMVDGWVGRIAWPYLEARP